MKAGKAKERKKNEDVKNNCREKTRLSLSYARNFAKKKKKVDENLSVGFHLK